MKVYLSDRCVVQMICVVYILSNCRVCLWLVKIAMSLCTLVDTDKDKQTQLAVVSVKTTHIPGMYRLQSRL